LSEYSGSPGPTIYLRKTDGSLAVRLSEDDGLSLSPDGRWVLALPGQQAHPDHLVLIPTGAGERRELRDGSLRAFPDGAGAAWFPDGKRIVVTGGDPSRLFVWDVEMSAPPRPLSPGGDFGWPVVSPDGRSVAATAAETGLMLYPVDDGPARPVRGRSPNDEPIRWSGDGRWLYVRRGTGAPEPGRFQGQGGVPAWIDRIQIATGTRQPWRELIPADPTGVFAIENVLITPDGRGYAYSFASSIGTLYLAEGLR
jgi:Tol biopolymer transport system component